MHRGVIVFRFFFLRSSRASQGKKREDNENIDFSLRLSHATRTFIQNHYIEFGINIIANPFPFFALFQLHNHTRIYLWSTVHVFAAVCSKLHPGEVSASRHFFRDAHTKTYDLLLHSNLIRSTPFEGGISRSVVKERI